MITLGKSELVSAQRLSQVLVSEAEAHKETAKNHSASLALSQVLESLQSQAVLTIVCSPSADSDALLFELERLRAKGYQTIFI